MALPDLQVVLWHNDRAAPRHLSTGVLAVAVGVVPLPQVLVGGTLSARDHDVNEACVTEVNNNTTNTHISTF